MGNQGIFRFRLCRRLQDKKKCEWFCDLSMWIYNFLEVERSEECILTINRSNVFGFTFAHINSHQFLIKLSLTFVSHIYVPRLNSIKVMPILNVRCSSWHVNSWHNQKSSKKIYYYSCSTHVLTCDIYTTISYGIHLGIRVSLIH